MEEYALKHKNLKVIDCKVNGGESVARNIGLENVAGEYLAFVDNDDAIDLDFFEKLYNQAKAENADICKGEVHEISYDGKDIYRQTNKKIRLEKNKMFFNGDWWSAIYKRSFIEKHHLRLKEGYILGADSLFVYYAVMHAKSLAFVDGVFYHYYRRPDSGSSQFLSLKKIKSFSTIIHYILKDAEKRSEDELSKEEYDAVFYHFFDILYSMGCVCKKEDDRMAKKITANNILKALNSYKYNKSDIFKSGVLVDYGFLEVARDDILKIENVIKEYDLNRVILYRLRRNVQRRKNV